MRYYTTQQGKKILVEQVKWAGTPLEAVLRFKIVDSDEEASKWIKDLKAEEGNKE